jgi:hypothetical protein
VSDIDLVIDDYSGNRRAVLEYSRVVARLVQAAKEPGFGPDGWQPLADLIATDDFVRVGNFKEVMDWPQYAEFLTNWAGSAEWDCRFKRVSEAGGVVFLELEEFSRMGAFETAVNSVSTYEFDARGLITRIDVYLQMELPGSDLLEGLEGADIAP